MKKRNNITTFEEHLDDKYGKKGTPSRDNFEQRAEIFRLGVMLEEIRKSKGMTQDQLAKKCGTSKTYISRIENGVSEIRLSTLSRIIHEGFGGKLILTVNQKNNLSTFEL